MDQKIETYLDRATEGLAGDEELRLDVRAELRTHFEAAAEETGDDSVVEETLKAFGDVVELAEDMSFANRLRLAWRARARLLLRAVLVPASIIAALWATDTGPLVVLNSLPLFEDILETLPRPLIRFAENRRRTSKLSQHQRLVLGGDDTRKGADQWRALWEKNPDNRVYYGDYITRLQVSDRDRLLTELMHGAKLDPDNARYPLLAAEARVKLAAELEWKWRDKETIFKALGFKVKDRKALDAGMRDLLAAMEKPDYHTYAREMAEEKLAVLAPPKRMGDQIRRMSLSASILLPDMACVRNLARLSIAYAHMLGEEGRVEEAKRFLEVPEKLGVWASKDAFTLIEMLVAGALFKMEEQAVPLVLREMGCEAEALRAERRGAALGKPVRTLRSNRKKHTEIDEKRDELVKARGGLLASLLLPALGGSVAPPSADDYRAGRMLEYTVFTQVIMSLAGLLILVAMFGCLLVAVRWRLKPGGGGIPILLLPKWRDMARVLLLGVVLPFAVFMLWTRFSPLSGHAWSVRVAWHRVLGEMVLLVSAVLFVPAWLALRVIRRRCAELDVPVPARSRVFRYTLLLALALVLVGAVFPLGPKVGELPLVLVLCVGIPLFPCVFWVVAGYGFVGPARYGRFFGTVARSLIPIFAAATVVLSLIAPITLRREEGRFLRADKILFNGEGAGFSNAENQLTRRLRSDTLAAAKRLE